MINLLIVILGVILAMLMMTVRQFFAELHGTARSQWTQTALSRQTLGAAFGYMHAARMHFEEELRGWEALLRVSEMKGRDPKHFSGLSFGVEI